MKGAILPGARDGAKARGASCDAALQHVSTRTARARCVHIGHFILAELK
ncbi:hypothetical protein [Paracraurococcus ruber]|nr:hypothetical protein [Paracraurococcus ruber]